MRAWLRQNKIFFETAATSLLSVMALLVSWGSYRISSIQTRIQRAQAQPTFVVQPQPVLNPESHKFEELRFTIRNVGAPAKAFSETIHSFLAVDYTGPLPKNLHGKLNIPVIGYLPVYIFTGDSTGLIGTLEGSGNTSNLVKLTEDTEQRARSLGGFAQIGIFNILELDYIDIIDDHQHIYYRVNESGGAPMDAEEAKTLLAAAKKADDAGETMDIEKIRGEDLLKKTPLLSVR